jgi:hypothetical protein
MSFRVGGRFYGSAGGRSSGILAGRAQAAALPQTVIVAGALRVVMPRPAAGNGCRVLVLRSRCRSRSMTMRRLARSRRVSLRRTVVRAAGRLAVAAPFRTLVMAARRAAVKEISLGWTHCPARLPLRAGAAVRAAARAVARTSSAAVTQAACSWAIMSGQRDRKIGPVDGPAPRIADLASRSAVSDPSHRLLSA